MTTRVAYGQQLQELANLVVTMASMVDKAILRSLDALRSQDVELAEEIRQGDKQINQLQRQGEEMVIMLIATQGPMAGDLRRIASTISILINLERMGDYAAGIAKFVIETSSEELLKPLVDLPRMADLAREMLGDAITAFMEQDADAARHVAARDDVVDGLYERVFHDLVLMMTQDSSAITRATHLLWTAHNIERIADRVTNICEQVVYTVTGEYEELDGGQVVNFGESDNGLVGFS